MADEQITLRFESTLGSSESNPLLLSGPIELFASVDTFDDLLSKELSDAVVERLTELSDKEHPNIVVFVNNITGYGENGNEIPNPNSQEYRGGYFLFVGDKNSSIINASDWQEILLGTHSHDNLEALEQLQELPLNENNHDKIVGIDGDGNYIAIDKAESGAVLPELPIEILNYKKEREEFAKLHEPEEGEKHHLDAKLSELQDTYDWLRRQPDGSYKNLAVGSCRELYHELLRLNKNLYLTVDFKPTREKTDIGPLLLESFSVNYNTNIIKENCENAIQDRTNPNHLLLKLAFPFTIPDGQIFIFDGIDGEDDKFISDENCSIIKNDKNTLTLVLNKSAFEIDELRKLTILFVENFNGVRFDLINSGLNLYEINNELIKLYIEGEFNRKPDVPKYYLSTDAEGKICWDNKLLPSQTFFHLSTEIDNKYIENNSTDNYIKVEFDAKYVISDDFPLLMINEYFAFDLAPDITDKHKDKNGVEYVDKFIYYIPKDRDVGFDTLGELEDGKKIKLTLVVIKNSSSGSIANELAKDYVSKKDAVAILSHGKIKLSDYAKNADLMKYSPLNHTHSQYALKSHNHDYRYAMYHHTHPELALLIKEIAKDGVSEEDIEKWLKEQEEKNKKLFNSLIKSLGLHEKNGAYYLDDTNALLSNESINEINEYLKKNDLDEEQFKEGMSVKDAICLFARLFEKDTVKDSQVLLEDPIRSIYNIGGITKDMLFDAGTDLRTILTQMMNPFIGVKEAIKILTPKKVLLKWYKRKTNAVDMNDKNGFYEIDPKHLLQYEIELEPTLYFEIVGCLNADNEKCEMNINKYGQNIKQETKIFIANEDQIFHEYKITDTDDLINIDDIEFSWEIISGTDINKIWDNYGLNYDEISNVQILKQKPELEYGYPAIFIGVVDPELDDTGYPIINNDIYKTLTADFLEKKKFYKLDLTNGKLILILVDEEIAEAEDLVIRNCFTGNRIEDFFVQARSTEDDMLIGYRDHNYVPMVYDVQTEKFEKLKITIERLTRVGGEA